MSTIMPEVFIFKPKHELEHENNLNEFLAFCRKLPPLNEKYDYESNYWDKVGNFTIFGANSRKRMTEQLFDPSFMPFAKAYIVYGGGGKSAVDNRLKALRAIHASRTDTNALVDINVTKLTANDFNNAAEAARKALGKGAAYQAGRGLANLLKFLIEHNLISRFSWKNPILKPAHQAVDDDDARQEKMPDEDALMALARVTSFKMEELSPRDIFTTSTMALLFSAPNRGSEPLYLLDSCIECTPMNAKKAIELGLSEEEVKALILEEIKKAKNQSKQALIIDSGNGSVLAEPSNPDDIKIDWDTKIIVKGIKWYSGKGYGYENKWLPTVMYQLVEQAIARLQEQSKDARNFAKMLEDSPSFPRHKLCPNVPEEQLLTMNEAALALGLDLSIYGDISDSHKRKNMRTARNQILTKRGIARKDYTVNLVDLNKIIRDSLPDGFPYIPFKNGDGIKVKWSQSLYASFSNSLESRRATIYTELQIPTINTLNEDLAPTKKKNRTTGELASGVHSIFQRWGYGDLVITSHQLRHMLDTMAAVNGMDGEMRAKWAMRSDPAHNRYYDHTTYEEYGEDFIESRERELASNEMTTQPKNEKNQVQLLIATARTIQELNTKASLTAHTTEFGMCIASYISEPCTKYRDCLNCDEQVCVKGDDDKCERVRQRLKKEEKLLKMDKKAVDDGVQGALRFYESRALTVERAKELISMFEDPNIEDGSLIKLTNLNNASLLDRAMDINGRKRLPNIINYQRTKQVQKISVDEMIRSNLSIDTLPSPSADDDISFEDLDEMNELYFPED